jgi:hypothetical protein
MASERDQEQLVYMVEPPDWVVKTAVVTYVVASCVPSVVTALLLEGLGTMFATLVALAVQVVTLRMTAAPAGRFWDAVCTWNARRLTR